MNGYVVAENTSEYPLRPNPEKMIQAPNTSIYPEHRYTWQSGLSDILSVRNLFSDQPIDDV